MEKCWTRGNGAEAELFSIFPFPFSMSLDTPGSALRCLVQGKREDHDRADSVAGHLQAEFDQRLKRDGDQSGGGADPDPVRHRVVLPGREAAVDGAHEKQQRDELPAAASRMPPSTMTCR